MTDTNPQQADPLAADREQHWRRMADIGAPGFGELLAEIDRLRATSAPVSPAPADQTAISARLWAVAEHNIIAEWICCEPINPEHDLCVQGDATRQMVKALLVDDPEAARPAPLLDAVLAVLPEPTNQAAILREAADTVDAMNEGCGRRQPCTSCNTREDVADALRRLADAASGPGGVAGDTPQPETQADDEGLRAKVDDATSTLRRIRTALRTLKEQGATGQTYHQVITNALAGPRPDETPEPETEADIVREHVTTVHLIGEQLADVESWLWKRLAEVRAEQPVAVSQPDEEAAPCTCAAAGAAFAPAGHYADCPQATPTA
jgi:hypothetical protein